MLANDTDPDGDTLALFSFSQPTKGSVTRDDNGTASDLTDDRLTYTPPAGFNGTAEFSYTVDDGKGGFDSATVTVTVGDLSQAIAFDLVDLQGVPDKPYTSLQFGPDGRLYAAERFGTIYAFDIGQNVDPATQKITSFSVLGTAEEINLVKNIPNHDDDGQLNTNVANRQITGIVVTGTVQNPIVYVSSSDPREGGGSGGGKGDVNLDTNSGIISKLTWTGSGWEKLDLVRGLPRSEENHSTNGMTLGTDPITGHTMLYVAQGGHTNAGAPSTNFAFQTEYALSAAILSVDLTRLENPAEFPVIENGANDYVYDLPTVNDPTLDDAIEATRDPFGGNNGLNQARLVAGGPVQVYASGFRNSYDIVITEAGKMYTIDNGANKGWGGLPNGEGTATVNNNLPTNDPDGFNSVNNLDHLEYISGPGYYGGHPNPIRANPNGAGLYTEPGGFRQTPGVDLPTDWPPVDPGLSFPNDGDFLLPGVEDQALTTWPVSTNGLTEYTASTFGNAMKGDLITAAFDSAIYRITPNADSTSAVKEQIASGLSGIPLDVTVQGDNGAFPGTIWIGFIAGTKDISVLVPTTLTGSPDDTDGDGYSNEDELANGSNPNNPSSVPPDNDQDFVSDLNDPDDDNDTLTDPTDHFALAALNGKDLVITDTTGFFNPLRNDDPGFGFQGLGFTGWMNNGTTDYLDQYDDDNLIAGGTSGIFSILNTTEGDAKGATNTQDNGFQFGITPNLSPDSSFLVNARMLSVMQPLTPETLLKGQSAGMHIGTGDQDNYIKLAVAANDDSTSGNDIDILILHEENGVVVAESFVEAAIEIGAQVDLFFEINPGTGTVIPAWQIDGGTLETGTAITLATGSKILAAIQGTYQNGSVDSGLAVGVISTHSTTNTPFAAQYDHINVYAGSLPQQSQTTVLLATRSDETIKFDATDTFIYSESTSFADLNQIDFTTNSALPSGFKVAARASAPDSLDFQNPVELTGLTSPTLPETALLA